MNDHAFALSRMLTVDQYSAAELASIADSLKRLTATTQPNPAPQSSVEIESFAKPGCPPKITVKIYAADADEAAARAVALYDQLVAKYALQASSGPRTHQWNGTRT